MALSCIEREFPGNPGHVLRRAGDLRRPRALHPAFFGCFDWHSAVHAHWLLAHLLRRFPHLRYAGRIRAIFDRHFSRASLDAEARYLEQHPGFERPYGWAWLLKLADEMRHPHLRPLVRIIEARYLEWLPKQAYPVRAGTHANTAFGLAFALDHARLSSNGKLEKALVRRSLDYFGSDRGCPAQWEPGGNDFLSPCLVEADLMRRVVGDFPRWFRRHLPELPRSLAEPAKVTDRADGQLAHLDGLNLSRAWCFYNLAKALPGEKALLRAAQKHLAAGLRHVASGHYEGEHWLATFAAYALACAFDGNTTAPAARRRATCAE